MTCGKGYSNSCPGWDLYELYVSPYIRVTTLNGSVINQAKQGDTVKLQCRVKKDSGHTCDNIYGRWYHQVQSKEGLINTINDYTYSGTGEWLTCEWTIPDDEPVGTYNHFGYYVPPDEWLFETPFTILPGKAKIRVTGPGEHDFGEEFVGHYSSQMQWAIYNDGSSVANVSVELEGMNPSDFSCSMGCGQHTIEPGGSIGIIVRFYPQSEGEKATILNILCSDCEMGHQGTLTMLYGTGVTAVETIEVIGPLNKNFGQTAVNSCSDEQTYEIKNTGTLDTSIQFTFVSFEQFECNNCISVSIPVGQSHFFSVKHCPIEVGNNSGVIEVFNVNVKYILSFEGQGALQPPVTCWRCNEEIPESQEFPYQTVCGIGDAIDYPYSSIPNCIIPINCSAQTNQPDCEANDCYWYAKLPWEEPQCWDKEQDLIKDNLPLILIGGGVIILLMSS